MKRAIKPLIISGLIGLSISFTSCDPNGDFVLFSVQNDIDLGAQMAAEIEVSDDYPILSRAAYPDAYNYLEDMRDEILNNADLTFRNDFDWDINIIDQNVLNAFVTPGGHIYVYNGLMQFLDNADDLAGVLGHEMAHADQRHSSKQLQRELGIAVLLEIALGNDESGLGDVVGLVAGIGSLKFSRGAEAEADAYSVEYLSQTHYACNGAAAFFQKLIDQDLTGNTPEFLSTHPNPENRVEDINTKATEVGCSIENYTDTATSCTPTSGREYQCFKENMLPDLN